MGMSAEEKALFKKRMAESLRRRSEPDAVEVAEEREKLTPPPTPTKCRENEKMFSELFGNPDDIGLPDFPIKTFFHEHTEWPEWVRSCVPDRDPHYQWNLRIVYAFMVAEDEHTFLVGLPGSGKTTLPEQVAAVIGRPMFKQSFSQDLEADEWIMSKEIDDSGTHWKMLPFVESLSFPFYTVLDEFNRLRRGGRLLMNRLLEDGGTMQLRDGTEVSPHPEWRAIATDNTRGMGDGLDMFDGDVADISTTDRFGTMLEVGYLPMEQQIDLLISWYPDLDRGLAKYIVSFGVKVVEGFRKGSLPLPWTPRRMRKAGKLTLRYRNPVYALKDCYYNFLAEDEERRLLNQLLKDVGISSVFGEFEKGE